MQSRLLRVFGRVTVFLPLLFVAADWPQFRGPGGQGVSSETGLPTKWGASSGIAWQAKLPGFGASSPIVIGRRVILTCYSGYGLSQDNAGAVKDLKRHVLCYSLEDGKLQWDASFASAGGEGPYQGFTALHGYASATPASDGESVFAFFGVDGMVAVTLDGQTKWRTNVGSKIHDWGSGASPVLYENLVIVNASVEAGSLAALDKQSGQVAWRAEGIRESWNTPALVQTPGGSTEVVVSSKNELLGFDPRTGKQLWRCDGIQDYVCPSVLPQDGVLFVTGGRRGATLAVRAGGRGDVTKSHVVWQAAKGSNVTSPVYDQGYLYWVHESRGSAYCADAKTGKILYEERLSPRCGKVYGSPVAADGKIYIISREAGAYVLAAKPEFELVAHNEPLDKSIFNGSPAVADGKLLLRSDTHLYCLTP